MTSSAPWTSASRAEPGRTRDDRSASSRARRDTGRLHGDAPQSVHSQSSFIDVLDRVLDKGIVFDAWIRLAGIDLITVETHVFVASIDTYPSSLELNRVLFIVAVDQPALFETLRGENSVTWTNVVLDRRCRQRRRRTQSVAKNRRQAERRLHDIDRALKSIGMAVVLP